MNVVTALVSKNFIATPEPIGDKPPSPELQSGREEGWELWAPDPTRDLTPKKITAIYSTAEAGYPQQQCDLFERSIERDAHLQSQTEMRSEAVAGKDWILQPGGDKPIDAKAAEALEDHFRHGTNFPEFIEFQLSCPIYGWAGTELQWDVTNGGKIAPVFFANVPHRRFVFDERGAPHLIVRDSGLLTRGVPLEQDRWFFSARTHRLIAMAGLMRTAVWWSLFKRMAIREWVSFLERFGLPFPYATYPDDMPDKEKDAIRRAVAMLGKEGYAAFSGDGHLEFADAGSIGSADTHPALATFCNAEISKLITGATLTSGEGTSAGSYALGRVHENVSFTIQQADARRLGNWFARFIGAPFVKWNYPDAKPPRLKIHVVREMDPAARMAIYSIAANELGAEIEENQFRQEFQLKDPPAGGKVLKGTKGPAADKKPAAEATAEEKLAIARTASILANDCGLKLDEKDIRARFGFSGPEHESTALIGTKPLAARALEAAATK